MPTYEWRASYDNGWVAAEEAELIALERDWSVKLPAALKQGFKVAQPACIWKSGMPCPYAINAPASEGGDLIGVFHELHHIGSIRPTWEAHEDYADDVYDLDFRHIVPFGFNGEASICLNYANDPTRANPEVWDFYTDLNSAEEGGFLKVADDFDTFIEMLVSDEEYTAMGFRD